MAKKHIADGESVWIVLNTTPDFCKVGKNVIPFDIVRTLDPEKTLYAKTVHARGERVLMIDSITSGVVGNAGRGVWSKVSRDSGHVWMIEGASTVYSEGRKVVRHMDECWMNCRLDDVPLDGDIGEAKS